MLFRSDYTLQESALLHYNYVNGTNYSGEVLTLEEYNEIFGSHEWNEINLDEQIIFDGNEMFWAVF